MSGGKTQTATQQVQIPPEVMARYRAVNQRAETAAAQPFQAYSQDPNAFVAPLTQTQQAAIQNINQAAGMTQPYFQTAAGLTLGGAQGVGPLTQQQIQYYQNPFTQSVVGSTLAGLQQQQGQALSQQQAEAIRAGAFGGDRAGIQRAMLQGQQGLATAQAIAPLYQQGYQQAVQTAMGQQGVMAQDLQRQLMAGQQLGGLGAQAQQAALAGAQAQLGAGTAEQQTQQAGLQALYNQFLQERGYPFQVAQFLANIAMGTGALSGSTTTTQQPAPFFSDEDNKKNIRVLGKDPQSGLNIIAYDDADDLRNAREYGEPMPPKRVSYSAQEIEERAPGLVREVGGNKVVDVAGGLGRLASQSMGGLVGEPGNYASGGQVVGPEDMRAILAAIGQPLEFYGGKGLYGGAAKGGAGAPGYVSAGQIATPKLVTAGGLPRPAESGLSQAAQTGSQLAGLAKMGKEAFTSAKGLVSGKGAGESARPGLPIDLAGGIKVSERSPELDLAQLPERPPRAYRGGLIRDHYDLGGSLPYATGEMGKDPLQEIGEDDDQKYEMLKPATPPAPTSSGLGDIVNLAKTAASIYSMSDERMKDNVEQVGELYDGQPVYRYNMKGSPKTQLGLLAQDVERDGHGDAVAGLGGVKMVDYKRATDVAAGLAPRQGFQEGGVADIIEGPAIDFAALAPPEPPRDERKYEPEALRQLVREYGREVKERRPGFNPEFAERVFQGESGFDSRAIGDDKSSFGVPQLHMGNISERYPRPGLGDEFMKQTGLDPRDPKNARAMIAWAMDYAAEKGWQPWTVARELIRQGVDSGTPAAGVAGGQRPERATGLGAPERVTPGLAGPGRGPMDPASAPFLTMAKRVFGIEGEGTPTQKALTSENFWVPALAGIGTMLASRSPYLAGAVGEGLVGGTKAYTDLQKQQQEMGESRARAEEIVAGISQKAFFEFAGRGMVRYLKPDGTYGAMNFADYFSLPRDKRPPVDPRFQEYLDQIEATYTKGKEPAGGGVSGTTTGTTTQPAAPGVTPEGRPSGVPTTVDLLPQDRTQAFDTARQISLESRSTLDERRKNDFFQPQRALATASQGITQNTLKLASDILSLPEGQSLATSGKFTNAIGDYVAAMNNFVEVITGRPGAVIEPGILGTRESIDKEIKKLQAQVTSDNGQRAVAALEEMAKTLVSLGNSKEGQRLILAKVLTDSQRNIDKDRWFSQWIDAGSTSPGGERGAFSDYARLSGQEANREFDRRYGEAFYTEDRKNLGKMMSDKVEGTPMTTFEYVRANAANLPAEQIVQIADRYGVNTLRYFGIDPSRVEQIRQQTRSPRG